MRDGIINKICSLFIDVRLERGNSFTLREAVVIGLSVQEALGQEPESRENSVPVLTTF